MNDVDKFRRFFKEMGILHSKIWRDMAMSPRGGKIITVAQTHFTFTRMGMFKGTYNGHPHNFQERVESPPE